MPEFINSILSLLSIPPEHQLFVVCMAAIGLCAYAIYAILSVVKGR